MKKNHIFSTGSNYGGKYYGRGGSRSAAAKKGWETRRVNQMTGDIAHQKIDELMKEATEEEEEAFREYYENLGDEYDATTRLGLYRIIDRAERGESLKDLTAVKPLEIDPDKLKPRM